MGSTKRESWSSSSSGSCGLSYCDDPRPHVGGAGG